MTEETYKRMKELVLKYEQEQANGKVFTEEKPYLIDYKVERDLSYNKNYGDNRICECGHTYYRHFDSYEQMEACGCKYCGCYRFEEKDVAKERRDKILKIVQKLKK